MKRYIIMSLCVLSMLLACDRNESMDLAIQDSSEELQAYDELLSELQEFNSEFGIETRAKGKFWKKLGWITLNDLGGYLLPYIIGIPSNALAICMGAISSLSAFVGVMIETRSDDSDSSVILGQRELYLGHYINDIHDCDSAGYWHNLIINDIYEADPTCFPTYTIDQIPSVVEATVINHFPFFEMPNEVYSKMDDFRALLLTLENKTIEETFDAL